MNYSFNVCMKCNCREHDNYISKNKKFIIHRCDCGHTWRTKNPEYKEEKKKAYIVELVTRGEYVMMILQLAFS